MRPRSIGLSAHHNPNHPPPQKNRPNINFPLPCSHLNKRLQHHQQHATNAAELHRHPPRSHSCSCPSSSCCCCCRRPYRPLLFARPPRPTHGDPSKPRPPLQQPPPQQHQPQPWEWTPSPPCSPRPPQHAKVRVWPVVCLFWSTVSGVGLESTNRIHQPSHPSMDRPQHTNTRIHTCMYTNTPHPTQCRAPKCLRRWRRWRPPPRAAAAAAQKRPRVRCL